MKRKDGHQSNPVGYQGRDTKIPFSLLNYKTIRQGEDFPGHCLQVRSSPSKDFGAPRKQGTFSNKQEPRENLRQMSGWMSETRQQKWRPLKRSGERKNSAARVVGTGRENLPTTSEPSPEKDKTSKSKEETSRLERNPQGFAESPGCLEYTLLKKYTQCAEAISARKWV